MSIAVNVVISGICLLVPGSRNEATRMTCPNATTGGISSTGSPIPPHFPYLIIDEANLADPKSAATATFRFGTNGKQLVWILDSAAISIKELPTSTGEVADLAAAADLSQIWPASGKVKAAYWDIARNPDKVSARFDLRGARVTTGKPGAVTWEFQPKQTPQSVVQRAADELIARFDLPAATIQIRNYGTTAKYETVEIPLRAEPGRAARVEVGNAPLNDVLLLPSSASHKHAMHDFELFYRLFERAPARPPIPIMKDAVGAARAGGSGEFCIPAVCTNCR